MRKELRIDKAIVLSFAAVTAVASLIVAMAGCQSPQPSAPKSTEGLAAATSDKAAEAKAHNQQTIGELNLMDEKTWSVRKALALGYAQATDSDLTATINLAGDTGKSANKDKKKIASLEGDQTVRATLKWIIGLALPIGFGMLIMAALANFFGSWPMLKWLKWMTGPIIEMFCIIGALLIVTGFICGWALLHLDAINTTITIIVWVIIGAVAVAAGYTGYLWKKTGSLKGAVAELKSQLTGKTAALTAVTTAIEVQAPEVQTVVKAAVADAATAAGTLPVVKAVISDVKAASLTHPQPQHRTPAVTPPGSSAPQNQS